MMLMKPNAKATSITRKQFLRRVGAAATVLSAPIIIPSGLCGAGSSTSPSDRVTVGAIGFGNRGAVDVQAMLDNSEVQVVAVCDVHESQRTHGKQAVDKHYGNTDCATYRDFRELLTRKGLDAVLICAPDHWHTLMAAEAARHAKHIYCEKPMGWSMRAAHAAKAVIEQKKIIFQFGTQQRSDRKFLQACELVRNGRIGKLQTILVGVPGSWTCPKQEVEPVPQELDYDLWLGPAPRAPYCYQRCRPYTAKDKWSIWYSISDYCLGMIGNWGVHHLDIAQWGNNTELSGPQEIEGKGEFPQDMLTDCAMSWRVENRFANGVTLVHMDNETSKKHPLQVNGFGHGVTFLGSEGWVHVRRGYIETKPESLLETKFGSNDIRLIASEHHHNNFIDAVKGRSRPAAPIEVAVRVDTLCNLQQIAIKLNRKLRWDPAEETFIDDEGANRLLDRPMRAPWKLS